MLALGAKVVAASKTGERVIPIEEFFVSLLSTALKPGEILTEIRIPIPPAGSGGAYFKLERKVGDFATAAVAVQITVDAKGACQKAGIGLTNVGVTAVKAGKAEEFLRGKKVDEGAIRQAAQLAADEAQPTSDLRGPAEYKKGLVKELTQRALLRAIERARK
jgi:carbon-monoxide dehydrogenase medium subunit